MTKKVCCVIGHCPNEFPWDYSDKENCYYQEYSEAMACYIDFYIRKHGVNYFICGDSLGVDMDFAETVIALRDNVYSNIQLEIALPYREQSNMKNYGSENNFEDLLKQADNIKYVSDNYSCECMMKRNRYMVDSSDIIFAFWNKNKTNGETYYTMKYAKKQGKHLDLFVLNDY